MSNQIGQMLSMIFLAFFIIMSGEVISYQNVTSKCMSITNELAIYLQEGYEKEFIYNLKETNYFDEVTIISRGMSDYNYTRYTITTTKSYQGFSNLFSFFNEDIVCELSVCRKEH